MDIEKKRYNVVVSDPLIGQDLHSVLHKAGAELDGDFRTSFRVSSYNPTAVTEKVRGPVRGFLESVDSIDFGFYNLRSVAVEKVMAVIQGLVKGKENVDLVIFNAEPSSESYSLERAIRDLRGLGYERKIVLAYHEEPVPRPEGVDEVIEIPTVDDLLAYIVQDFDAKKKKSID